MMLGRIIRGDTNITSSFFVYTKVLVGNLNAQLTNYVWLYEGLVKRNAYVRHWLYKRLVELFVLKKLFKYSDSV